MKLSEVIRRAIPLSKATCDYWEVEKPKRHPKYPFIQPGEDDGPPPPEQVQLKELLDGLSDEDVYRLQLLIECGRWEFGPDKFAKELQEIKESASAKLLAAVMGDDLDLWMQLEYGLDQMNKHGIDVDATFPVAKSA